MPKMMRGAVIVASRFFLFLFLFLLNRQLQDIHQPVGEQLYTVAP